LFASAFTTQSNQWDNKR